MRAVTAIVSMLLSAGVAAATFERIAQKNDVAPRLRARYGG